MEARKNTWYLNTIFLMTAGVLLAWSLVSAIVSTTVFEQSHFANLIRMVCIVGVLGFLFSRKSTTWISVVLCLFGLGFLAVGFFSSPPEPHMANEAAEFIRGIVGFIAGYEDYTPAYEQAIIWALNISFGLLVVLLGHVRSRFVLLFLTSAGIMGMTITSPFFSYPLSFYVFVVCILAFLIRHLSRRRDVKKTEDRLAFPIYALPMALICIGLAALLPPLSPETSNDIWHSTVMRPIREVNDILIAGTGPEYFSLAQTGFDGSDHRRLGGNVMQDHRMVMRLQSTSPMPIYLTGAILDTYTGSAWVNTLDERDPLDFGNIEQNLALYERATSGTAHLLLEHYDAPTEYATYTFPITWEVTLSDEDLDMRYVLEAGTTEEEDGRWSWWNFVFDKAEPDIQATIDYLTEAFGVPADNIQPIRRGMSASDDWRWVELEVHFDVLVPIGFGSDWLSGVIIDDLETRNAVIGILNNRTRSVFYPDIVRDIFSHSAGVVFLQEESGRILTEERMPRDNWYTIQYHPAPSRAALALGMLQHSYRGVLRDISATLGDDRDSPTVIHNHDGSMIVHLRRTNLGFTIVRQDWSTLSYLDLLDNYLIPRADWIYETYTALPAEFPARIRNLAYTVTADAENDYLRARMLENFLSSEFQYTLTPGLPPQDMDFVEYFLFYGQRGYCTYFATAFVTMARSIGLPARYVEGFMVTGQPDEHGFFSVLNSMGHAWGEIYFEGFGWKRFEPTPGGGTPAGIEPNLPFYRPPDLPAMGPEYRPDSPWDDMGDVLGQDQNRPAAPAPGTTDPAAPNQGGQGAPDTSEQGGIWLPILLVILVPIAVLTCRALWIRSRDARAKRQGHTKAVIYYYSVLLKYLKFFEFEARETETPLQFNHRVAEEFGFPSESFFPKKIAEIFGKARFGGNAVTLEERRQIEDEMHRLAASIESYTGRGRYLFYKYILAIV